MKKRPNVVIYASHDTGRHISPYGIKTVQTPNAAQFAKRSVLFRNAFCTAPQCSPSRASLFTGLYPHSAGLSGLARRSTGFTLADPSQHLSHRLKQNGYATALFGIAHETFGGGSPQEHLDALNFDFVKFNGYASALTDAFEGWLINRKTDQPFYAQITPSETHRHFGDPESSLGVTCPEYLEESEELLDDVARFQGDIKKWDEGLGRILSLLQEHGLTEETIVIVTTDHGIPYPRAKASLYDAGIEIMLMVYVPSLTEGGKVEDALISNVDILPTILEAIGIESDTQLDGQSFWPLLIGNEYTPNEYVFSERTFHTQYDPMRSVRTDRFKYIRNFEAVWPDWFYCETSGALKPHLSIHGVKESEAIIKAMSPKTRPLEELYDLTSDPMEMSNLAGDAAFETKRKELSDKLCHWMEDTQDPLLKGPIGSPVFYDSIADLSAERRNP